MANTVSLGKNSFAQLATDPLRNFKYRVTFSIPGDDTLNKGFGSMGFMSVSGLNVTTEVIPYRTGGLNTTTQKMPGQSDFAPITLSSGLAVGPTPMIEWMRRLFTVQQGTGGGNPGADFRGTMLIDIMAHPWTVNTDVPVRASVKVYNAWPTSLAISDLDAGANALMIQQMTLAHEGWDIDVADNLSSTASL